MKPETVASELLLPPDMLAALHAAGFVLAEPPPYISVVKKGATFKVSEAWALIGEEEDGAWVTTMYENGGGCIYAEQIFDNPGDALIYAVTTILMGGD
jgi:hypothetical protein